MNKHRDPTAYDLKDQDSDRSLESTSGHDLDNFLVRDNEYSGGVDMDPNQLRLPASGRESLPEPHDHVDGQSSTLTRREKCCFGGQNSGHWPFWPVHDRKDNGPPTVHLYEGFVGHFHVKGVNVGLQKT